eukprot:1178462-Prymnesium_polylepis.1
MDNLHLHSREKEPATRQLSFQVTQLGRQIGLMNSELVQLRAGCLALEQQVRSMQETQMFTVHCQSMLFGALAQICTKLELPEMSIMMNQNMQAAMAYSRTYSSGASGSGAS